MAFDFKINSLTFRDDTFGGKSVAPKKIVVFIGPNNAGKSTALKEIRRAVLNEDDYYNPYTSDGGQEQNRRVFSSIDFSEPASACEVIDALNLESKIHRGSDGQLHNTDCCDSRLEVDPMGSYRRTGSSAYVMPPGSDWRASLQSMLEVSDRGFGATWDRAGFYSFIGPSLVNYMGTEERLLFSVGAPYRGYLDYESNFISTTVSDELLYETLSKETMKQFGKSVYADLKSRGGIVSLRTSTGEKNWNDSFLNEEGDGFRSFVATYLSLKSGSRPLLLLDEPEAFLHPPQARRLAQIIGETAREAKTQIFLATHSSDILNGLISSCPDDLTIIRIHCANGVRRYSVIEPAVISEVLASSLHFSNIVDALFSQSALLVEGKDDAVFIDALLDILGLVGAPICVGVMGKSNFSKAAVFLHAADVPFEVMADFDVLKDKNHYSRAIKEMGCDNAAQKTVVEKAAKLTEALKSKGADFKNGVQDSLAEIGPEAVALSESLLSDLYALGFWVLRDGELESSLGDLVPYSTNKNAWLDNALAFIVDPNNRGQLVNAPISRQLEGMVEKLI